MDFEKALHLFQQQECTHIDVLDILIPLLHAKDVDMTSTHEVDERIVQSFPLFFRTDSAVEFSKERLGVIPSGTIVHGLYTIEETLDHSLCFYRYTVRVLDSQYVLCVLRPEYWDGDYEEDFLREVAISRVLLDSQTRCIHACTASIIPFLVYKVPSGGQVKDFLMRHRIPDLAVLRRMGLQMCTLVADLHEALMSHLGIRMEIFGISSAGMFLRNFGIEERLSTTKEDVSRVRYLAPEQLDGGYTDAKTDVYALGILLCRLYNGQFPFPDKNRGVEDWHRCGDRGQVPFLDSVHPDIQEVFIKAIHPEPMLRYDTANHLKEAFCQATSQVGWYIFDRQLLPKITGRICRTHLHSDGRIIDWSGSVEEEFGDVFPTWRLYGGELLLSIDPQHQHWDVKDTHVSSENLLKQIRGGEATYGHIKQLYIQGFHKECMEICVELEEKDSNLLLLAYVFSSIFSHPKKSEELLSRAITAERSFSQIISLAVFTCWHRMDEVTTKKLLVRAEDYCHIPRDRIMLAQSYAALLEAEEDVSRHLHLYIQEFASQSFQEQCRALLGVIENLGRRPELVRWGIRLEEGCTIDDFILMEKVWVHLDVPNRARKMEQKRMEMIRLTVQQTIQKLVSLNIAIPEISKTNTEEMLRFIREGGRMHSLGTRRQALHELIQTKGIPMNVQNISLEEDSIAEAEKFCASFVLEAVVDPVEEESITEEKELKIVEEPQPTEIKTDLSDEANHEIDINKKIGALSLQIASVWGILFMIGFSFWYSCS